MKTKAAGFLTGLVLLVITCAAHAQDNVFFGNLHSHTSHSDGSSTPDKAYKHARDVGLHFLAITEHTTRRPAISRTFTEGQANTLQPNGTIRVRSGPSATGNVAGTINWTTSFIWNNESDPAELIDTNMTVVAEQP